MVVQAENQPVADGFESRYPSVDRVVKARDALARVLDDVRGETERPTERLTALMRPATEKLRRSVALDRRRDPRALGPYVDAAVPLANEERQAAALGFPRCGGYTPEDVVRFR